MQTTLAQSPSLASSIIQQAQPVDLADILARIQATTQPDRELDAILYCLDKGYDFVALAQTGEEEYGQFASPGDHIGNPRSRIMKGHMVFRLRGEIDLRKNNRTQLMGSFDHYTSSVDATLGLAERLLPQKWPLALQNGLADLATRFNWLKDFAVTGQKDQLALAILSALFTILISEGSQA